MKKVLHSLCSDSGLLIFIIFVGAFLRFYSPFEIPFTHDELSALFRLQFDNFTDLIEGGVRVDGHPAFVHVFLYYWTSLVGQSEFAVKLPFLIWGVGSIALTYKIGRLWYNSTIGLVASTFVATLQFPIMYSQIARPYISGMFFCLLLVYFWTRFLFHTAQSKRMYWGMIISASLCTYNHYFSLMFAGIVGITGLFFITIENRKNYLLGFIYVAILFFPHLSIFLHQFSLKGLSWLGKPSPIFCLEHLQYIFHFNKSVYLLVISILGIGLIKSKHLLYSKYQYISLIWFLLPLLIGLSYSIWVKPVIQHSMLLFSFPFLTFFIVSFLPSLNLKWKISLILIIGFINTSTLINQRKHYQVFYKQPFEQTFKLAQKVHANYPSTHIILNGNPNYHDFYFNNSGITFSSIFNKTPNPATFRRSLINQNTQFLLLSNVPSHLQEVAKEYFPYLIIKQYGLNREDVFLSKVKLKQPPGFPSSIFSQSKYYPGALDWFVQNSDSLFIINDNFNITNNQEFGPHFEKDLNGFLKSRFTQIHVQVSFKNTVQKSALLTVSLSKNGKQVMWMASNLKDFQMDNRSSNWSNAYLDVNLLASIKAYHNLKNYSLKVGIWNKEGEELELKKFQVVLRPSNPIEYSIIEPINK